MEEHSYVYQWKHLIIPGLAFLFLYPLTIWIIYLLTKFSAMELKILTGIYVLTAVGIIFLWVFGKSKRIIIEEDRIIWHTLFGERVLLPSDIRRISLHRSNKGEEIVRIKTGKEDYYLNELYFPFPELMSNLENFIRDHRVKSNI